MNASNIDNIYTNISVNTQVQNTNNKRNEGSIPENKVNNIEIEKNQPVDKYEGDKINIDSGLYRIEKRINKKINDIIIAEKQNKIDENQKNKELFGINIDENQKNKASNLEKKKNINDKERQEEDEKIREKINNIIESISKGDIEKKRKIEKAIGKWLKMQAQGKIQSTDYINIIYEELIQGDINKMN